ncbi:hypothetical protein M1D93_01155 [Arthrobacter sp. Z1-9]
MISKGSEPDQLSVAPPQAARTDPASTWPSRPEAVLASPWEGLYDSSPLAAP